MRSLPMLRITRDDGVNKGHFTWPRHNTRHCVTYFDCNHDNVLYRRFGRNNGAASGSAFRDSEKEHAAISSDHGFVADKNFLSNLLDFLVRFASRQNEQ